MTDPHTHADAPLVSLVGAGPGDPRLITLEAVDCIRQADVILYDYLVNPQILDHAPADAESICLGRHGHTRLWSQAEINQRMIDLASAQKRVVRLKGGDPGIFAHGADEAEALAAARIPFRIVPGVTAALAAGSCAGVPLTHRQLASAVALVTGHEDPDKLDSNLNYEALARFPGTLVFYMGVTTAGDWTAALMQAGKPADTPALIMRRASCPDQQIIRCPLKDVAGQIAAEQQIRPPAIVIVGEVAAETARTEWILQRPLLGKKILVTRAAAQAGELVDHCWRLGAAVISQPAIEISAVADTNEIERTLESLAEFDWLVFSSANGVRFFFDALLHSGRDMRALAGIQIATIGPATSLTLKGFHLNADLQPDEYRAEALAESLKEDAAAGKRFLLLRASRGREVLAQSLVEEGGQVTQVVVYESCDVTQAEPSVQKQLEQGQVDWITVTSSAIARSLVAMLGDQLRHARLASISPLTSSVLRELGHEPAAEADVYTMEGLLAAIQIAESDGDLDD